MFQYEKVNTCMSPPEATNQYSELELGKLSTRSDVLDGIAWRNLSKTVFIKDYCDPVALLRNVSGVCKRGEMMAIMGTSGSGKSTLLQILSGRNTSSCTGDVFVGSYHSQLTNSHTIHSFDKRQVGYIAQDDLFFYQLTVEEHLSFTARLRSPSPITQETAQERVHQVLQILQLLRCKITPIAHLSGGERKRCSIATELLARPQILLLDEATSGLDSAGASSILTILHQMTKLPTRLAILLSIHQPSASNMTLFTKVMFLSEGRVAYYGNPNDCQEYLRVRGYPSLSTATTIAASSCNNPAEYFIELLFSTQPQDMSSDNVAEDTRTTKMKEEQEEEEEQSFECNERTYGFETNKISTLVSQKHEDNTTFKDSDAHPQETEKNRIGTRFDRIYDGWWPRYILIDLYDTTTTTAIHEVDDYLNTFLHSPTTPQTSTPPPILSFYEEYTILVQRAWCLSRRSSIIRLLAWLEVLLVAILAGCTWFQTTLTESQVVNFTGFLFFLCAYWFFAGVYAGLLEFLPEKALLRKEYATGAYRISTYYLARTIAGLPTRLCLPVLFTLVACLLALSPSLYLYSLPEISSFVGMIGCVLLTALCGEALGVFIGIALNRLDRALSTANVISLAMTIFGGFYIHHLPSFMQWCRYVSLIRYCFDALCQSQFRNDLRIDCDEDGYAVAICYLQDSISGEEVRKWLEVDSFSLGSNICMLVSIFVMLKLAGYIALVMHIHE